MAELAESNEDRLQIDGHILLEQLEGLATVQLVMPSSSTELQVGMNVAFLDVDADSGDRYHGSITSVLSDTQVGLMFDRMAIALEVEVDHDTDAPESTLTIEDATRLGGG